SPSRNSTASCTPVDAPEGTAARPTKPFSVVTSTSIVGFPRESNICRACTSIIKLIVLYNSFFKMGADQSLCCLYTKLIQFQIYSFSIKYPKNGIKYLLFTGLPT